VAEDTFFLNCKKRMIEEEDGWIEEAVKGR